MAASANYYFRTGSYGRSVSDDGWEVFEPANIELWKLAVVELQKTKTIWKEANYDIHVDWRPILRLHERHYEVMQNLEQKKSSGRKISLEDFNFPKRSATVKVAVKSRRNDAEKVAGLVQSLLHDVFLIMNITAPGCCDFYRGIFESDASGYGSSDLSLSNVYFELAQLKATDNKWPIISTLEFHKVLHWFQSIRSGIAQLPQNPMEKALFALLHISKIDMSPMIVIWLLYAFESLLQTRVGENFSSLIKRLELLLQPNEAETVLLKKGMRSLYNIRSAIVHGGFEIVHPMHHEILDKRVDDKYIQVAAASEFGMALLIAAIQATIRRQWRYPLFNESITGAPR